MFGIDASGNQPQSSSKGEVNIPFVVSLVIILAFGAAVFLAGKSNAVRKQEEARKQELAQKALEVEERRRAEQELAQLVYDADANMKEGSKLLAKGHYEEAGEMFLKVRKARPDDKEALRGLSRVADARADAERRVQEEVAKEKRALEAEQNRERRRDIAGVLRNHFLDNGLDIKVTVKGKSHDRLRLEYVLFNDVWRHRISKEGLISQWCAMGFQRIDMSDGYDWNVYWTCN